MEPGDLPIRSARDAERAAAEWLKFWGAREVTLTSEGADVGIDVEALDLVAQVKAQASPVPRPVVQALFGIGSYLQKRAVLFVLAGLTPPAAQWADAAGVAVFQFDLSGRPQPLNREAHSFVAAASRAKGEPTRREAARASVRLVEPIPFHAPWHHPLPPQDLQAEPLRKGEPIEVARLAATLIDLALDPEVFRDGDPLRLPMGEETEDIYLAIRDPEAGSLAEEGRDVILALRFWRDLDPFDEIYAPHPSDPDDLDSIFPDLVFDWSAEPHRNPRWRHRLVPTPFPAELKTRVSTEEGLRHFRPEDRFGGSLWKRECPTPEEADFYWEPEGEERIGVDAPGAIAPHRCCPNSTEPEEGPWSYFSQALYEIHAVLRTLEIRLEEATFRICIVDDDNAPDF